MDDHYFTALAAERRREILQTLLTEPRLQLEPGADEPAERAVSLYHVHLPMLEDAGLIEWNRATQAVVRGCNFDELEPMSEYLRSTIPARAD